MENVYHIFLLRILTQKLVFEKFKVIDGFSCSDSNAGDSKQHIRIFKTIEPLLWQSWCIATGCGNVFLCKVRIKFWIPFFVILVFKLSKTCLLHAYIINCIWHPICGHKKPRLQLLKIDPQSSGHVFFQHDNCDFLELTRLLNDWLCCFL